MDAATRKVFDKLCANARTNGPDATMTRAELQNAAGLSEKDFNDVLRGLRGLYDDQDLKVCYVGSRDTFKLGISWLQKCGLK